MISRRKTIVNGFLISFQLAKRNLDAYKAKENLNETDVKDMIETLNQLSMDARNTAKSLAEEL